MPFKHPRSLQWQRFSWMMFPRSLLKNGWKWSIPSIKNNSLAFGCLGYEVVHSRNLTEIPRIAIFDESYLFQGPSFWVYPSVSFRRCTFFSIGFLLANRRPAKNTQFCSWRFCFVVCGVLQTKNIPNMGGLFQEFLEDPPILGRLNLIGFFLQLSFSKTLRMKIPKEVRCLKTAVCDCGWAEILTTHVS